MAEREASGDFDYLFDDRLSDRPDERLDDEVDDEFDGEWDDEFDAFDTNTWYFEPAPTPWYRTRRAILALTATVAAAIAIVVSGVLLVFQSPPTPVEDDASVTPTAPTTAAPTTAAPTRMATSASAPPPAPPPPPPPPPATSAAPIERAPVRTNRPRSPERTTKQPEIGVTRTPATRSPISVAPQRPDNPR